MWCLKVFLLRPALSKIFKCLNEHLGRKIKKLAKILTDMQMERNISENPNTNHPSAAFFSYDLSKLASVLPKWSNFSAVSALFLLALVIWGIEYSLFKEAVAVDSTFFRLEFLFICAKIVGVIVGKINIPPLVGMLIVGVLFQNTGFVRLHGPFVRFSAILRQLALVNILLPAGLGLDAKALKKMSWTILNLAVVPVGAEVLGIVIMSHLLMDLPWLWATLLGILLAAVSPAVIFRCLLELQSLGYGVNKGIHTLVIAAATFNDVICITLFGIVLDVIFSEGTLYMQILRVPIVLAIGFTYGIVWGLTCQYVPSRENEYLITLRTVLLGLGCVLSAIGSDAIGYRGAGALGCIVSAFVASLGWIKQGWDNDNPVKANFVLLWKFFEPICFSLIGMEIIFSILELNAVLLGTLSMIVPLILRMVTSFCSTQCNNFNLKERFFIALCWLPKATVQAALGPAALDIARARGDPVAENYANTVLKVAVVSILLTAPIGAIIIMLSGSRLLHRTVI